MPVTILIDGVDALTEPSAANLTWLPATLPSNCSLLLSCSTGSDAYEAAQRLEWVDADGHAAVDVTGGGLVKMPKLSSDDVQTVASAVLRERAHKTLEAHHAIWLSKSAQASNPLFLTMVMEELIASAVFETLDTLLKTCLAQPSTTQLADLVFTRLESQFGARLVREVFAFIETARFGMSELELLAALKLSQHEWFVFVNAVRSILCESAGQFLWGSSVMRRAFRARYLAAPGDAERVHMKLIAFFRGAPAEIVSEARRCSELPFHLLRAGEHEELKAFLVDIGHVRTMITHQVCTPPPQPPAETPTKLPPPFPCV